MDPNQACGTDRENDKGKEKDRAIRRRTRLFKRYLERRKTDTIVDEDASKSDISIATLVRRSQSDKTEYSSKLKEKMRPPDLSTPTSPVMDPYEIRQSRMRKRVKVVEELVRTERDFQRDLELCISEVLLPLRAAQVVDVDRLFTNIESVCDVSAELLHRLQEATSDPNPETQLIGEVFIQAKAVMEEVFKIYCYHHDEANALLKTYEAQEEIQQHFRTCVSTLKKIYDQEGKPNLLDMGSLLIKPVQRIMKYPLLLAELWSATPTDHPDYLPLQEALTTAKIINVNINEFKRRKDIVLKYKRSEDETSLMGKLNKLNIHSIRKKSDRWTSYFKILTGVEPQVRDEAFDREEKMFRSLEKAVRQLVKNIRCYLLHAQDMISVAVQNAQDLEAIMKDPDKIDTNGFHHKRSSSDPYKQFKEHVEQLVLAPLSCLLGMFSAPQKLIQKRYDKLLDFCSQSSREEQSRAEKDYQALNAQLLEELQRFNQAVRSILTNCLICVVKFLKKLMDAAQPPVQQLPVPLSNLSEVQNAIMDELSNLGFVKENSQKLMERKVSFEKRERKMTQEVPRQTEEQRLRLLEEHQLEHIYQLKRNCNACQEQDISLLEGDLVALLNDKDPTGSSSRWLVETGITQGYVYSSFLKTYNPQREVTERPDDFDNLSLFVSCSRSNSLRSFSLYSTSNDSSPQSGAQDEPESPEEQHFYAVYAFQARCDQELTMHEHQHVRILRFSDLGGNKDWWLAEANGQTGYVPANYLGKMSYA